MSTATTTPPKITPRASQAGADVVPIRRTRPEGPGEPVFTTGGRVSITAVTSHDDPDFGLWADAVRVADLPIVRARMPIRDSAGKRRGWQYLLGAVGDPTAYLCSAKDLTTGDYADRCGIDVPEDRTIRDACITVIRRMARDAEQRELTAGWVAGRLCLPPIDALPPGYLDVTGDESDARRVWRRIGELACLPDAENLALCLGGAYAAPYPAALSKVKPVSFALVGMGGARLGKTTNASAAAGWYGAPMPLNPAMSESPIAIGDQLAALGVLPLFRDEAHAVKWTPEQWKQHWMLSLNGAGRRRSPADGSGITRYTRGWWGVQWVSGNFDPRFGATDGVQARVIGLNTPHLPSAEVSDEITDLLGEAYGWPIRWQLDRQVTPDAMRKHASDAYAELLTAAATAGFVPTHSADTVARSLGLAVAGAELAGTLIDAPGLRAAAVRAAVRVLRTLADEIADQAMNFGDQLYQDVTDDVQRYPGSWPNVADYELMRRERSDDAANGGRISRGEIHGFRAQVGGREIAVMLRPVFEQMITGKDYAKSEALTELRKDGRLLVNRKTGFRWQKRINGGAIPEKFYAFRLDADHQHPDDQGQQSDPDVDEQEATPADNTPAEEADVPSEDTHQDELPLTEVGADGQGDAGDVAMTGDVSASTQVRTSAPTWTRGTEMAECVTCHQGRTLVRDAQGHPRHPSCIDGAPAPIAAPSSAPTPAPAEQGPSRATQIVEARRAKQAAELDAALTALQQGESLRLLRALETTHTPRRRTERGGRMAPPYRAPELPPAVDDTHVVSSWAWQRPYNGDVTVLDANAAWPSAVSSVDVAHSALEHTGNAPFIGRPGTYQVAVYQWTETFLPSPLGFIPPGQETVWIPAPMVKRLIELAKQDRWPDVTVLDSYTGEPVRLHSWADFLKTIRTETITRYGRESDQYAEFKSNFGIACSLMLGTRSVGQRRQWKCEMHRPDWTHAIQSQASMKLHRWADECRMVTGNDLAPVGLQNVDELVIPTSALEIVTTKERPGDLRPMLIDPSGIALGSFKVKRTEVRNNA